MKKRIFCLALALLMLVGMLPVSSFAEGFTPEPPECDQGCNQTSVSAHQDQCAVKEYYRGIYRNYSAQELYNMKDILGEDAWAFIVSASWNLDNAKAQELNTLIQNGGPTTPENPCKCCEKCTGAEGCECGCGECDFCEPVTPENPCKCCENCTGAENCECGCENCQFCEPEEPEYPTLTDPETNVEVTLETLPEGVNLEVDPDADVSQQLAEFGIPAANKVFGMDISLISGGAEYQPDAALVKVPVSAPVGTKIGILHNDTFMGVTEVLSDNTVEFYTDSFSEFAGFTVDFHYEGVDYSIAGLTSIKLSELFTAMGINEDAFSATSVVFSDNSLVTTERLSDGDWLLTSLEPFQTEETLIITFTDGHTIVIDVTDAYTSTLDFGNIGVSGHFSSTGKSVWNPWVYIYESNETTLVAKDQANNVITTGWLSLNGDYWFEMFNWEGWSGGGCTYVPASGLAGMPTINTIALGAFGLGTPHIYVKRYSRVITNSSNAYCAINQASEFVKKGDTTTRNVEIYVDGTHKQTISNVLFPHRGEGSSTPNNITASDITDVTPRSGYYRRSDAGGGSTVTTSGSSTYQVWLVTRGTIQYDANGGSGAPAAQYKYHGVNLTLQSGVPTKSYSTFKGWATSKARADAGTVDYTAGATYTGNLTSGSTVTLYAVWDYAAANYTVKHLQQNVAGTGYVEVVADRQTIASHAHAEVKPAVKSYTGFKSPSVQTVTVNGDGSTVVEYKYDRLSYTVTTNKGTGISAVSGGGTYKYGASVTIGATVSDGYSWENWTGYNTQTAQSYTFTMPASNVTYTANATRSSYSISYELNGGTVTPENPKSYTADTATFTLTNPTKEGYTFDGWTGTGLTHATQTVTIPTGSTGNRSYTANWTPKTDATYTVHYYKEGTTEKVQNDKVVNGATFDQVYSETAPETIGNYTLVGAKTQSVTAGYSNNVITFYYKQNASYSVSYQYTGTVPAGAPAVPVDSNRYYAGDSVTVEPAPSLAGYTFTGWSKTGTFTITGDTVITGSWTPINYTISYNLNGGTLPEGKTNPTTYTVKSEAITLVNPSKTGHNFTGWTGTDLTQATQNVTIPTDSTGNRSYTANWTPKTDAKYIVHYYVENTSTPVQPDEEKTGKTFNQSYSVTAPETIGNYIIVGDKTKTVTAGYTGNEVTFYYKLNAFSVSYAYTGEVPEDAAAAPAATTATVGSDVTVANAPTLTGYTFSGWSADGITITNGKFTMPNKAVTFTGSWSVDQYVITYQYADDQTTDKTVSYSIEDQVTLEDTPTREGYEFKGWKLTDVTDTNWTAGTFAAGAKFNQKYGDVTFVAQWEAKNYTITYDLNDGSLPEGVNESVVTYDIEDPITLMAAPTREGYKFSKWNLANGLTAPNGNWAAGDYNASQQFAKGKYGDIELVAQWTDQYRYTLHFEDNTTDQVGNMPTDVDTNWIDAATYTFQWTQVPTRENYDFLGWATSADATEAQFQNSYQVTQGKPHDTEEVTLYAVWKRQTGNLELTFDGDNTKPAIVTVTGQGKSITVVLTKEKTVIKDLPTGEYTVTAESGRATYTASVDNSNPTVVKGETVTVGVTISGGNSNWFTAFFRVKNKCS